MVGSAVATIVPSSAARKVPPSMRAAKIVRTAGRAAVVVRSDGGRHDLAPVTRSSCALVSGGCGNGVAAVRTQAVQHRGRDTGARARERRTTSSRRRARRSRTASGTSSCREVRPQRSLCLRARDQLGDERPHLGTCRLEPAPAVLPLGDHVLETAVPHVELEHALEEGR